MTCRSIRYSKYGLFHEFAPFVINIRADTYVRGSFFRPIYRCIEPFRRILNYVVNTRFYLRIRIRSVYKLRQITNVKRNHTENRLKHATHG